MSGTGGWIVIVDIDPLWKVELVSALRAHGVDAHSFDRYPDAMRAIEALDPDAPALVVFGPHMSMSALTEAASTPRPARVAIMAVRQSVTVEALQHAMRAGALDVRSADEPLGDLLDGILAAADHQARLVPRAHLGDAAPTRWGRLVMVCGAKGGVGVTTVAVNLATALTAERPGRVVLADGDPRFGDILHRLQLLPVERPDRSADIEVMLRHDLRRHEGTGLLVLAAPVAGDAIELVPHGDLLEGLTSLQTLAELIVIDVPAPARDEVDVLRAADELVLVCRSDERSVEHAALARRLLDAAGIGSIETSLVVNEVVERGQNNRVIGEIVGVPVAARLPGDGRIQGALRDLVATISTRTPRRA